MRSPQKRRPGVHERARSSRGVSRGAGRPRRSPRDASPAAIDRLLARQSWDRVPALVRPVSADVDDAMVRLRELCARVLAWNRGVSNLMARSDEARIVERHLVESLEHAGWLAASGCARWIDLGSGAGFPAIPLAIAGVGPRWTLVESRRIKALFLRKTLEEMRLGGVIDVVNARLEAIDPVERFDAFTARAAGKIGESLGAASSLVVTGGSAFLWKGSRWREEIEQDRSWERNWRMLEHRAIDNTSIVILKFNRL